MDTYFSFNYDAQWIYLNLYMEMSYEELMNRPEWKLRRIYDWNLTLRVQHGLEMSRLFLN
jgi:hypothetical protein